MRDSFTGADGLVALFDRAVDAAQGELVQLAGRRMWARSEPMGLPTGDRPRLVVIDGGGELFPTSTPSLRVLSGGRS